MVMPEGPPEEGYNSLMGIRASQAAAACPGSGPATPLTTVLCIVYCPFCNKENDTLVNVSNSPSLCNSEVSPSLKYSQHTINCICLRHTIGCFNLHTHTHTHMMSTPVNSGRLPCIPLQLPHHTYPSFQATSWSAFWHHMLGYIS